MRSAWWKQFITVASLLVCLGLPVGGWSGPTGTGTQGVADLLGKFLNEAGAPVAGGSLTSIEHIIDNWDTIRNPCPGTLRLLGAIFKDARDGGGQNFAFAMLKTFDLPQFGSWTFAQLEAEGEYLSSRLQRNRTKNLRALRRVMNEIRRQCYPPRTSTSTAGTTGGGTSSGGSSTPPSSGTTTPPAVSKPEPKPAPEPEPEPEPQWSVDNPCPECQGIADQLKTATQRLGDLHRRKGEVEQQAIDNQLAQADIGEDIAELQAGIEAQKGAFAESFDPESGLTKRAENIGGGKVRVTTKDGDGNVIDSHERESVSARRAKEKIEKLEKQLQELKQKEAKLRGKIDALDKQLDTTRDEINRLTKALEDCVREKCNKGVACPEPAATDAIRVGSNDTVGSGAHTQAKVEETVGGLLGGMLGGGGGGLLGGGGGDGEAEGPETRNDPVADDDKITVTDASGDTRVKVGGVMTPDGLLISSMIDAAPGDGTFQTVFLQDARGQRAGPVRYLIYHLYQDWSLTVNWTYDRWVDGEHVEHREGGWSESGRNFLGTFHVPTENQGIWKRLGFDNAVKGVRSLGTQFPITAEQLREQPVDVVIHVTRPDEDPVMTTPLVVRVSMDEAGNPVFTPATQTLARENCH